MIVAEVKKVERVVVTMSYDDAQMLMAYFYTHLDLMAPKVVDFYNALVAAQQ